MFKHALVALDLSPAERPILNCLPALQRWGVQSMTLTHIIQTRYPLGAALAREQDYINWLTEQSAPLTEAGLKVEIRVEASADIAGHLLAMADAIEADLIVIGSRGQNLMRRLFLGSVARELIRRSQRPVLLEWIEPTEEATRASCTAVCSDMMHHVVLATDFSEAAAHAEQVFQTLSALATESSLVHVQRTGSENEHGNPAEQFASLSDSANKVVLTGTPCEQITQYAREKQASLIIVGKHGRNRLSNKLIGSTAEYVGEKAGRPVLLIP